MMKLPEYLTSTPRLIAILLTLAAIYLVCTGKMDVKDFVSVFTLVLGYFFGSRGSEAPKLPDATTQVTTTSTPLSNASTDGASVS